MKRPRLRRIGALVVGALAVAWWMTCSSPHTSDSSMRGAPSVESGRVEVELVGSDVSAPAASRSAAANVEAPAAPRRESPDDWVVLVVDGSTEAPVAGAQVAWTGKRVTFRDSRRPLVVPDPESFLDADARWIETDARGLVRLPPDALPGFVCARHGSAFGSTGVIERREDMVRIRLRRALHVDIQVVDAGGHPVAGVPVSLCSADPVKGAQPVWTGITAGDSGLARARHFENGLARLKPPFDLVAGFEFPTRTASTVPVDVDHLPLEPVRLVLPPAGSVEVLVHDARGEPVLPMSVDLNVTTAGEQDFTVTPHLRQFTPASVEKGRALFPFVETGLDLTAQASADWSIAHASGPGPRANGERVAIAIDTGPAKPLFVGRLVDQDGFPISDADVQCGQQFTYGDPPLNGGGSFPVKTTALGRFEFSSFVPAQVSLSGTLSLRPFGRTAGAGGTGSVRIDAPLRDGENDLGDIVVRRPLVLVAGFIVDEHDVPIGNALLGVEVEGSLNGLSTWESDAATTGKCDETGAFKIVSTSPRSKLRLRAQRTGFVQLEPLLVTSGPRDVKITLWTASEVSGSVIVEPETPVTEITVFLRAPTEPGGDWKQALANERVHVRSDGTFRLADVRPLVFDLAVRRSGMKEPLVVVPGLDLRGGGPAKDPRLEGIDLRGRLPIVPAPATPSSAPR